MRVLFDGLGLQAMVHLEAGTRLRTLVSKIEAFADVIDFTISGPLTREVIAGYDVLISTTRHPANAHAYTHEELAALRDSVKGGAGLLLMSNHGDLPGSNAVDWTRHDAALAREFGVELERTWFENAEHGALSSFSGESLLRGHPIIEGSGGRRVESIVVNNCSSVVRRDHDRGHALVALPPSTRDLRSERPTAARLFALALDRSTSADVVGEGRIVVMTDSGFIGDDGSEVPGPGLIGRADNLRFVLNVVRWLGRALPERGGRP